MPIFKVRTWRKLNFNNWKPGYMTDTIYWDYKKERIQPTNRWWNAKLNVQTWFRDPKSIILMGRCHRIAKLANHSVLISSINFFSFVWGRYSQAKSYTTRKIASFSKVSISPSPPKCIEWDNSDEKWRNSCQKIKS